MDDFLVLPAPYVRIPGKVDCRRATRRIDKLLRHFGLRCHSEKGEWRGSNVVNHLRVRVDTLCMKVMMMPHKKIQVRKLAKELLKQVRNCRRRVSANEVRSLCRSCISLSLALSLERFFAHLLYWNLIRSGTGQARALQTAASVRLRPVLPGAFVRTRDEGLTHDPDTSNCRDVHRRGGHRI